MTQPPYPPPYPPMMPYQPGGMPPPDPAAPARRAGALMLAIGALGVLFGICAGIGSSMLTPDLIAQNPQGEQLLRMERDTGVSIRSLYFAMSIVAIGVGGAFGGLAFPVRRQSYVAAVLGIIATGGLIALFVLMFLGALLNGPQGMIAGCMLALPMALCVMLLVALVQAVRAIGAARQAFHMAQWAQAMRQQASAAPPAGTYPPAQPFPAPPAPAYSPPAPTAIGSPQGLFGPAPFGVPPPPPEDTPAGRYGYATRPSTPPTTTPPSASSEPPNGA